MTDAQKKFEAFRISPSAQKSIDVFCSECGKYLTCISWPGTVDTVDYENAYSAIKNGFVRCSDCGDSATRYQLTDQFAAEIQARQKISVGDVSNRVRAIIAGWENDRALTYLAKLKQKIVNVRHGHNNADDSTRERLAENVEHGIRDVEDELTTRSDEQ